MIGAYFLLYDHENSGATATSHADRMRRNGDDVWRRVRAIYFALIVSAAFCRHWLGVRRPRARVYRAKRLQVDARLLVRERKCEFKFLCSKKLLEKMAVDRWRAACSFAFNRRAQTAASASSDGRSAAACIVAYSGKCSRRIRLSPHRATSCRASQQSSRSSRAASSRYSAALRRLCARAFWRRHSNRRLAREFDRS